MWLNTYDGKIDPICLTYALFTTVLSRAIPLVGGPAPIENKFHWNVDNNVEKLADLVVAAYNDAISKVLSDSDAKIKSFHQQDAEACYHTVKESDSFLGRNRIVRVDSDPMLRHHLHWAVRYDSELKRYATFSLLSPLVIDPLQYKENQTIIDKYNPQRAISVAPTKYSPTDTQNLEALLRAIKEKLRKK